MTKLTNASLDVTIVPDMDYTTKVQLLLNSDDTLDIVCKTPITNASVGDMALNGKFTRTVLNSLHWLKL